MNLISSIVFGIIQGLTEFLPVSSSGHLALFQNILGFGDVESLIAFNVLLHLGTLIAVFIAYYKDILPLIPAAFTMLGKVFRGKFKLSHYNYNERFVILVIIATIPLVPAVFIEEYTGFIANHLSIIGAILVFNGLVLYLSDKMANGKIGIGEMTPKKSLFVGCFQAVAALLPGLSRSGSTITGGLLSGFDRQSAVKFSFIMSLPAILGACIIKLPDLFAEAGGTEDIAVYLAGAFTACVVGILSISLLKYIAKKSNFKVFSYYCFGVGILSIGYDIVVSLIK